MFEIFKKKKKKEEQPMSTLEQVRKAYEDLSEEDKKSFHQSIADRVHESIAAQERDEGDEDSQSAEAREHEALGAAHADGEGRTEELHEEDDTPEEKREDARDEGEDDFRKTVLARLDALEARSKDPDADAEKRAEEVYGLGGGLFQGSAPRKEREMTPADVAKTIRKLI